MIDNETNQPTTKMNTTTPIITNIGIMITVWYYFRVLFRINSIHLNGNGVEGEGGYLSEVDGGVDIMNDDEDGNLITPIIIA